MEIIEVYTLKDVAAIERATLLLITTPVAPEVAPDIISPTVKVADVVKLKCSNISISNK